MGGLYFKAREHAAVRIEVLAFDVIRITRSECNSFRKFPAHDHLALSSKLLCADEQKDSTMTVGLAPLHMGSAPWYKPLNH